MGNSQGLPLAPPPNGNEHFSLVFRWPDRLVTVYALPDVQALIRQAILKTWSPGIYEEGPYYGDAYRFKFNDCPFMKGTNFEQAVAAKRMTCEILASLHASGWQLIVSSDLSRYQDLTTWFFRRIGVEKTTCPVCCVSLSSFDKLQIINVTDILHQAVETALKNSYPLGGKMCRTEEGVVEFQLEGSPWYSDGQTAIDARKFLVELVEQFENHGYRHYGVANLKGPADSLYFIKDQMTVPGEAKFFAISLNRGDRLRLLNAPNSIGQLAEETVRRIWAPGIQHVQDYHGAWECKLAGEPWLARNAEESVAARLLLCALLSEFLNAGWAVHFAVDVSRTLTDKSVFILRSCAAGARLRHACLSLNSTDCIRLLNFPSGFEQHFFSILQQRWFRGIESRNPMSYQNSVEYTLHGCPFGTSARGGDGLHFRAMMCAILKLLEEHGFKVIASADVSAKYVAQNNGPDYPIDVHSWFLVYLGNTSGNLETLPEYSVEPK